MPRTKSKPTKVRYQRVLKLPPLPNDQYEALRANIAINGVLVPIIVDSDGLKRKIIDGNYRKQIADELSYDCPEIIHPGLSDDEKRTLARALNLARRQMNTDQKRELIGEQIQESPGKSCRWIGKMLGVHHSTVSSVKTDLASRGDFSHVEQIEGQDGKLYPNNQLPVRRKRKESDFYETPYSMTEQLLEKEDFKGTILEPASGDGAISRFFKNVVAQDLADGLDFLEEKKRYDNIVTNPPFSLAFDFIQKSKQLARRKIAMLLPLSYLHGKERYDQIWTDRRFPLARVYVFTRYPMLGDELRDDGKYRTGMMVYGWFIWEISHKGEPVIRWIDNNEYAI